MSTFNELKQRAANKGLELGVQTGRNHDAGGYYKVYSLSEDIMWGKTIGVTSNLADMERLIARAPDIKNRITEEKKQHEKDKKTAGKIQKMMARERAKQTLKEGNLDYLLGNDDFAHRQIAEYQKRGMSQEKALEVYTNNVEGDTSQLPPHLAQYAKKKGWLRGYD